MPKPKTKETTFSSMNLPEVLVPDGYEMGKHGLWTLCQTAPSNYFRGPGDPPVRLYNGYWSKRIWQEPFYYVRKKKTAQIAASRTDREALAVHVKHAKGTVVVCGVKMGLLLYNLCRKPDVNRIVVIDQDADLIGMAQRMASAWEGGTKIGFLVGDPFAVDRRELSDGFEIQETPDCLLLDMWDEFNPAGVLYDVHKIQNNIRSLLTGWVGQEIHFAEWCERQGIDFADRKIKLDVFDRWCLNTALVLNERSTAYMKHCVAVKTNQTKGAKAK